MFFSVIIPTHNRPIQLERCLASFLAIVYPHWELIVVNDGGDEIHLPQELARHLPLRVVMLPENVGPASARNIGAKNAKGDVLVFTDDDCQVEAHWLGNYADAFGKTQSDGIGGAILNPYPKSVVAQTWQRYLVFLQGYLVDTAGNPVLLTTNNVAYRRTVFEALGGFDENFPLAAAEDFDFGCRLLEAGYRQVAINAAGVWHEHRIIARGYLAQQWRYGRGSCYLRAYHYQAPRRYRGEFFVQLWRYFAGASLGGWLLLLGTIVMHGAGRRFECIMRRLKQISPP